MNELEIKKVPFMGTELMAARDNDGHIWAGVRWMCKGIGLSKSQTNSQVEKIKDDHPPDRKHLDARETAPAKVPHREQYPVPRGIAGPRGQLFPQHRVGADEKYSASARHHLRLEAPGGQHHPAEQGVHH